MKYRKKPVVVEAVQYLGSAGPVLDFLTQDECAKIMFKPHADVEQRTATILTLEGAMTCSHGDYIVRGIKGDLYPCKPDIFAATHVPIDKATAARLRDLADDLADDNARLQHLLDDTHAAYTKTLERAEEFAAALKEACDYIEPFPCKRPPGATADCEHVNCVASRKFRNALEKP